MNAHAAISLNGQDRAKVRATIKNHPKWSAYRTARGLDLSAMSKDQLMATCQALNIDARMLIGLESSVFVPPASVDEAPGDEQNQAPLRIPAEKKAPKMNAHTPPATDDAHQLAALLQRMAGAAPIDMAQVHTAIDAAGVRIRGDVLAAVADAMQNAPRNLITLQRQDGETFDIQGAQHPQLPTLLRASGARMANGYAPSIWLAGPAGSGKTHAAQTVAEALALAFHYNGAISMPHELVGFIDAAGTYHRTPFREAYEHGGLYLFDECDGSDNAALLALNAALANGKATFPDGQITRHKDSVIIATANTWGLGATAEYVGRAKIDAAFLSRFPVRLAWDYDTDLEIAISGNADFAKRVIKARAKARAAGIKVLIDPRASQAGAALIAAGMTSDEAAAATYLANLSADQRKTVEG